MAIAAKPKPRNTNTHRKRHGHHQKRNSHFVKTYWPYLPLLVIVGVGLFINSLMLTRANVLSYATDMTQTGLLSSTNAKRGENGLGSLALSAVLSQAAQSKAADMAARNYWSHNTPDGQEPWVFINQVGYAYLAAGENLAYGFATSNDAIVGWMNSPGHRANILNGKYTEVGFGIVNSASYQGNGEQTIVVAMYAQPSGNVASAPTQAAPNTPTTPSPQSQTTPEAAPLESQPISAELDKSSNEIVVSAVVPEQKPVTRVEMATSGGAPWSIFAVSVVIILLLLVFITRHSMAWHRRFAKGEKFILKHKVLDVVVVSAIMIGFILTRTVGVIQ